MQSRRRLKKVNIKNDEKSQKNILTFKNEFGILLMHLRKVENDL